MAFILNGYFVINGMDLELGLKMTMQAFLKFSDGLSGLDAVPVPFVPLEKISLHLEELSVDNCSGS